MAFLWLTFMFNWRGCQLWLHSSPLKGGCHPMLTRALDKWLLKITTLLLADNIYYLRSRMSYKVRYVHSTGQHVSKAFLVKMKFLKECLKSTYYIHSSSWLFFTLFHKVLFRRKWISGPYRNTEQSTKSIHNIRSLGFHYKNVSTFFYLWCQFIIMETYVSLIICLVI